MDGDDPHQQESRHSNIEFVNVEHNLPLGSVGRWAMCVWIIIVGLFFFVQFSPYVETVPTLSRRVLNLP